MRSDKLFGEEPSEINMHYENLREKAEKKILANGQTLRSRASANTERCPP